MSTLRRLFRWAHIVAGIWLSVFVFSSLRLDPTATVVAQVTIVAMAASGGAIWQWPHVMKLGRLLRRT